MKSLAAIVIACLVIACLFFLIAVQLQDAFQCHPSAPCATTSP